MTARLERPQPRKAKLCVWTDLNVYNTDRVLKCGSNSAMRNLFQDIFGLPNSARNDILLDLFMHAIAFSKLNNFSKEQTSTFFSIVKQTHEVCVSTPFGNVDECFSFFRELVLTHAVHRPPWSLEIFSPEQIETITTHVINTYFRHYKLYKYAFTPKVKLDISLQYEGLAPTPVPDVQLQEDPTPDPIDEKHAAATEQGTTPQISTPQSPTLEVPTKPSPEPEEAEVSNELENVVRKAVSAQLKQMHAAVDQQLEDTDKVINEKIQLLEGGRPASAKGKKGRSPKSSAKGKKK